MNSQERKICFWGIYNREYSRNLVLREGFVSNGWSVFDCQVDPRKYPGLKKYWQLLKQSYHCCRSVDFILVAYPGQSVLWLARLLFFRKKIIFDAFVSLYDSNVFDRGLYSGWSFRGLKDYSLDWLSWVLADITLTDTREHSLYWAKQFGVDLNKNYPIFVGTTIGKIKLNFQSGPREENFIVHFCGHFIPLQGTEFIIRAAKILEHYKDIKFRLIGQGQELDKAFSLAQDLSLSNVEFSPNIVFSDLALKIKEADVSLGIFGLTPKAGRVIPNKVFEGLALGKTIITTDTPAIRELLVDRVNVLLCQKGDPRDLADKILEIKGNRELRLKLEQGAREVFDHCLSPRDLVFALSEALLKIN